MLINFRIFLSVGLSWKFAVVTLKYPTTRTNVATLPCEILMSEN